MRPGEIRELNKYDELFPPLLCEECLSMQILYVGAHAGHVHIAPEMREAGHHLTLLEILPEYAKQVQVEHPLLFDYIKIGDVRRANRYRWPKEFDVVFWRYGPEHIPLEDLASTATGLEKLAKYVVIMVTVNGPTPWYKPDVPADHPMAHQVAMEAEHFKTLGYQVDFIPNHKGTNRGNGAMLVAWKWMGTWKWPSQS